MNPEVKAKWLAALRSGDYKQAKGSLKARLREDEDRPTEVTGVGYCCLGVLCEIARQEGGVLRYGVTDQGDREGFYDEESGLLPESVQQWAELKGSPEFQDADGMFHWLTDLNDNGKTFAQLADIIEENF